MLDWDAEMLLPLLFEVLLWVILSTFEPDPKLARVAPDSYIFVFDNFSSNYLTREFLFLNCPS